jgi:hypothetical protein
MFKRGFYLFSNESDRRNWFFIPFRLSYQLFNGFFEFG